MRGNDLIFPARSESAGMSISVTRPNGAEVASALLTRAEGKEIRIRLPQAGIYLVRARAREGAVVKRISCPFE